MSMTLVSKIRDQVHWKGAAGQAFKLLLMSIASHDGNGNTTNSGPCTVSYERLADETGCSLRTIERRIAALKNARWISIQRRGKGNTNAISINVEMLDRAGDDPPFDPPNSNFDPLLIAGGSKQMMTRQILNDDPPAMNGGQKTFQKDRYPPVVSDDTTSPKGDFANIENMPREFDARNILQSALEAIIEEGLDDEPWTQEEADTILTDIMYRVRREHYERAELRVSPKARYKRELRELDHVDFQNILYNNVLTPEVKAACIEAEARLPGSSKQLLLDLLEASRQRSGFRDFGKPPSEWPDDNGVYDDTNGFEQAEAMG